MAQRDAGTGTHSTNAGAAAVVLGLGTMVSHGFGLSLVPAMLPRIEATFGTGYGTLGMAIATGLIFYVVGASISSRILDRVPTRTVLNGSFLLTGAGLAIVAVATSPTTIAMSVALLGVSAPVSWTVTTHIAGRSIRPASLGLVMAGASGGVGAGVVINGALVATSANLHSWRVSFVFAALVAGVVTVASMALFRKPIERPAIHEFRPASGAYRAVLRSQSGRIVVVTSAATGVATFTFLSFLTATAVDELQVSTMAAAALLWVAGVVGMVASPVLGRFGDRASPLVPLLVSVTTYGASLILLAGIWRYSAMVVAAIGLGAMNYPVWGLVATIANRRFPPHLAVRAISLGLVCAAGLAAVANTLAGAWIDATGSMRAPVAGLAVITSALALWLSTGPRVASGPAGNVGDVQGGAEAALARTPDEGALGR